MTNMLEEPGLVVATEPGLATVQTQRKSACQSCSANKGCGTGVLSKVLGTRTNLVKAINTIDAKAGDEVIIGLDERALVTVSLVVYIVPLAAMIVGALLGKLLVAELGWASGEGLIAVLAFVGLGAGFLWVRTYSSKHATNPDFQPVLVRHCTTGAAQIKFNIPGQSGHNC